MTVLQPLPMAIRGDTSSRTGRDRLEVLHALMAAPNFDPIYREDVIVAPGDHPVYGWLCKVPDCERAKQVTNDHCQTHKRQWSALRADGKTLVDFLRVAQPLRARSWMSPPPCLICPGVPAWASNGLCFLHKDRWVKHSSYLRRSQRQTADFDIWLAEQVPYPNFGDCQVQCCPDQADNPLRLCRRHTNRYERESRPGSAALPPHWGKYLSRCGSSVPVSYGDKSRFARWCRETGVASRTNGRISLLGLRPLVKAEIQWSMFRHCDEPTASSDWALAWVEYVADHCRIQKVNSLADLDLASCTWHARRLAATMLNYLRLVYFSRQDTKAAGFIETDHFGVRFPHSVSNIDLTSISQRWLRDMLWDDFAAKLTDDPPRSRSPFDSNRRGLLELSAFLEVHAPAGGHDPALLTAQDMLDFVKDHRHRGEHGLFSLGFYSMCRGHDRTPTKMTKAGVARNFNGARRVLRACLDSGEVDRIGLDRGFVVALPYGGAFNGRRRPFSDEVARALADENNLENLALSDPEDRGLRDAWETLVLTGRRCSEVLALRLDCIGRFNGLPVLWHDQTKVGNYDEAIRIPEWLYQRIARRQEQTTAQFHQRFGYPPTPQDRAKIALFQRRTCNRPMLKGLSYGWFHQHFRSWVATLDIEHCVPHQARHTLATKLLGNGANLSHVKRYLGQVSDRMAEHYVHIASTDPKLTDALNAVWVAGPGSAEPGFALSTGEPMSREEAEALAIDLTRKSTPAEGGFCTYQPVVNGDACPWSMDCHNCEKFVMSGADLVYWHRKREQWHTLAERAPDSATADYFHDIFEPTDRAITGLEKALEAVGLLDEALALDLRRPQDYFGRIWSTAFRASELAQHKDEYDDEPDDEVEDTA
ncbi:tyrosine-type recombinase/integrase [Streptomyces sp. NPDC058287]|uniref:tyrosine-type recombinase/integrase n=1 Tax=unclassified Streptomyces TaxID=2593676 RepID=UPI0036ED7C9B